VPAQRDDLPRPFFATVDTKEKPMTDPVAPAKATAAALEDKIRAEEARLADLSERRKRIAFDAHAEGNLLAQRQLAELNQQLSSAQHQRDSLIEALAEAQRRIERAEADVRNAVALKMARAVLRDAANAEKLAKEADEAGRRFRESLIELERAMDAISKSGYRGVAPSRGMQLALTRAVQGLLVGLKQVGLDLPALPPSQRRGLSETVSVSIASARGAAQCILNGASNSDAAA
jgi:hypothetical protein